MYNLMIDGAIPLYVMLLYVYGEIFIRVSMLHITSSYHANANECQFFSIFVQ